MKIVVHIHLRIAVTAALLFLLSSSRSCDAAEVPRRRLENNWTSIPPQVPPTRQCGQIINLVTLPQIQLAATSLIKLAFPEAFVTVAISSLGTLFRYSVQAQVVCASCDEMMSMYSEDDSVLNTTGRFAFSSYCDSNKFAANVTRSALLLIPFDPDSGKAVVGTVQTHLSMPSFNFGEQLGAPSEYWLQDFDVFNSTDPDVILSALTSFRDGLVSLLKASVGVVVVVPDYLGYGQSYESIKADGIFDLYQQAAAISFLKSKSLVESSGCTFLSNLSSASGYSSGGASSIAGALAWQGLGQVILNVDSGGAPFRPSFQFAYVIDQMDQGTDNTLLRTISCAIATTFSSKVPGLPNTNTSQNIINDEWLDFMIVLADTSPSMELVDSLMPVPATNIFTTAMLDKTRDLLAQNITDLCYNSTPGIDDLLCQTLEENSYIDLVEATTFPISICHSPDDEVVPIAHAPNMSANSLLYEASLFGSLLAATGSHVEAGAFCNLYQLFQFSEFSSVPFSSSSSSLAGIVGTSNDIPSSCTELATPTPMNGSSLAPTMFPTASPTTVSSSHKMNCFGATTMTAVVLFLVVAIVI
ncbi:hypothetical protein MHU86_9974 [Fragilaria crotonensis]|nr:hypothetical protein MHU86_9974 [Fragilaria crotonensis]